MIRGIRAFCPPVGPSVVGRRAFIGGIGLIPLAARASHEQDGGVRIALNTSLGSLVILIDRARAPVTATHFLMLVEQGVFSRASFYRSVAPGYDTNPVPISVVQGGIGGAVSPLPPIEHESTAITGLRHRDGTISMARGAIGTASTEFFICLGENPELDAGGKRVADGAGFAAFGRVISGMEVVRRIHAMPRSTEGTGTAVAGQMLAEPVEFLTASIF